MFDKMFVVAKSSSVRSSAPRQPADQEAVVVRLCYWLCEFLCVFLQTLFVCCIWACYCLLLRGVGERLHLNTEITAMADGDKRSRRAAAAFPSPLCLCRTTSRRRWWRSQPGGGSDHKPDGKFHNFFCIWMNKGVNKRRNPSTAASSFLRLLHSHVLSLVWIGGYLRWAETVGALQPLMEKAVI